MQPELYPFRQSQREAGLWAELVTDPAILQAFRLRPFKFAQGFGGQILRRVFKPSVTGFWGKASWKCHDDNRTLGTAGVIRPPGTQSPVASGWGKR